MGNDIAMQETSRREFLRLTGGALASADTEAAFSAARAMGATLARDNVWTVAGFGCAPTAPDAPIDMANSGTSLRLFSGAAALGTEAIHFDGDASLRTRPMGGLLDALCALGATAVGRNRGGLPGTHPALREQN